MSPRTQPSFVVGVPACNEEELISHALMALLASADALDDPSTVRIVVACDSCVDATVDIVSGVARADGRVRLVEGRWRNAGAARSAAIASALGWMGDRAALSETWVATTDADTVVPIDWLPTHAQSWWAGDHAVAGIVDLLEPDAAVAAEFARHYALGHEAAGHGHVHGANLGVRADAYVAVGGFPNIELAEDHALWRLLRAAGFTCRSSVALRVATSARLTSRAGGGFADTLRTWTTSAASACTESSA